jgi:hypothetical protein
MKKNNLIKLSKTSLKEIKAGHGGQSLSNPVTCGDEPANPKSIEHANWLACVNSQNPAGATDFCPFG